MPAELSNAVTTKFEEPSDFSLVLGGPLYQLFLRARMVRPPLELYYRRIVAITVVAWLPLLLLAALDEHALGGVKVPLIFDLDTHARFLGAVPLLIAAELIVHQRMRAIVSQFSQREIVSPEQLPQWARNIAFVKRLRNSVIVEVLIVVFI